MNAKCYLLQLKKLDRMIENKMVEAAQWKAIAMSSTAQTESVTIKGVLHNMEKVQSSGNPQKMTDAIVRFIEIENELNEDIDRLIDTKKDVISVIEQLPAIEYDVIHKVYVQYMDLSEIAELKGRSKTWAKEKHKSGVRNVQKILDERKKSESDQKSPKVTKKVRK